MSNHVTGHITASTTTTGNSSGSSTRGPFAAALRNLAKQADGKDEEVSEQRITSNPNSTHLNLRPNTNIDSRHGVIDSKKRISPGPENRVDDRNRKASAISPTPPEKV